MERSGEPGKERRARQPSVLRRVGEQAVADIQAEQERPLIDLFAYAIRPPIDWQDNKLFKRDFSVALAAVIDQAAAETRLDNLQANDLRGMLGLEPIQLGADDGNRGNTVKSYIKAAMSTYSGRLAHNKDDIPIVAARKEAMGKMIKEFTLREEITADDVEKKFNDPQAALLLKGAIAEILRASIERAPYEREHGM